MCERWIGRQVGLVLVNWQSNCWPISRPRIVTTPTFVQFGLERHQTRPALGQIGVRVIHLDVLVHLIVLQRQLCRLAGQVPKELQLFVI